MEILFISRVTIRSVFQNPVTFMVFIIIIIIVLYRLQLQVICEAILDFRYIRIYYIGD